MQKPYLIVRRHPYEEPYLTQLEINASNGIFCGTVDFYCNVEDLTEIGQQFKNFPQKIGDEYQYEYGSENPKDNYYSYFLFRVYTTDSLGHCAIQIAMNTNYIEPHEGSCKFSIKAEAAAINRLGELFERFGRLEHLELRWNLVDGELLK